MHAVNELRNQVSSIRRYAKWLTAPKEEDRNGPFTDADAIFRYWVSLLEPGISHAYQGAEQITITEVEVLKFQSILRSLGAHAKALVVLKLPMKGWEESHLHQLKRLQDLAFHFMALFCRANTVNQKHVWTLLETASSGPGLMSFINAYLESLDTALPVGPALWDMLGEILRDNEPLLYTEGDKFVVELLRILAAVHTRIGSEASWVRLLTYLTACKGRLNNLNAQRILLWVEQNPTKIALHSDDRGFKKRTSGLNILGKADGYDRP
jgi:hypothetical protein